MTNCEELYKETENGQLESMIKITDSKNEDSRKLSLGTDPDTKLVVDSQQGKETPRVVVAKQLSVPRTTSNLFNNPFGSRGSMILKAALSDKRHETVSPCQPNLIYYNRQPLHEKYSGLTSNSYNNNNINDDIACTSNQKSPTTTTSDQTNNSSTPSATPINRKTLVYRSEKKRRSARKEVLFATPIVSERFIYEPTIVLDDPPSSSSSCSSNSDSGESGLTNARMNVTIRARNLYSPAKMIRTNQVRSLPQVYRRTYSSVANNPLVACDSQPRTPPSVRYSRKRPYIDEINQSPVSTSDQNSPICDADQSSPQISLQLIQHQSLFSPPKVAKIVPYFTDSIASQDSTQDTKGENANENQHSSQVTKDETESKSYEQEYAGPNGSDDEMFEDASDGTLELKSVVDKSDAAPPQCGNYYSPISTICQSLWSAWKQVYPL